MSLANLTPRELDVVGYCLGVIADGKVIKHDSEFQTLFGIEVAQLKVVASAWPNVDDRDEVTALAINNSMCHLLGLIPKSEFRRRISYPPDTVELVFNKWQSQEV
jgi:hypothetical protein